MTTPTSKKAVIEAAGRDGERNGEYPAYAVLVVTPELVRHLWRQSVLAESHGLEFALEKHHLRWERNPVFRMCGEMMWIRSGSIFFRAHPKHSRREAETWVVRIADLERLLASDQPLGFFGRNVADLAQSYSQSLSRKKEAA